MASVVAPSADESLALEVRAPYARSLASGAKTIDVRAYASREGWRNARVWIVETRGGVAGAPVLADAFGDGTDGSEGAVVASVGSRTDCDGCPSVRWASGADGGSGEDERVARVVGWCVFSGDDVEYADEASFARDVGAHLVDASSAFYPDFSTGGRWYGWRVVEARELERAPRVASQRRLHRSVHAIRFANDDGCGSETTT